MFHFLNHLQQEKSCWKYTEQAESQREEKHLRPTRGSRLRWDKSNNVAPFLPAQRWHKDLCVCVCVVGWGALWAHHMKLPPSAVPGMRKAGAHTQHGHHTRCSSASFLHLCGVASPPGFLRTSEQIQHRHVGKAFSERDLQILGQPGKKRPFPQQNMLLRGCQVAAATACDVR